MACGRCGLQWDVTEDAPDCRPVGQGAPRVLRAVQHPRPGPSPKSQRLRQELLDTIAKLKAQPPWKERR